jgi:hypothetical protein
MGLFRVVSAVLSCMHCEAVQQFDIQFKTGSDELERYILGELIPEDENIKRGETYEGITDLYCEKCFLEWRIAEVKTYCQALMKTIEQGQLVMFDLDQQHSLSTADIRAVGERRISEMRTHPSLYSHSYQQVIGWLHDHFKADWEGRPVLENDYTTRTSKPYATFYATIAGLADAELKRLGWQHSTQWLDGEISVFLDANSHLGIETPRLAASGTQGAKHQN